MKITYEKVPASAVRFTIEVPASDIKTTYDKITKQILSTLQVPGFRKGKAPKELALRYAGADKIHEAVLQKVLEDSFLQAIKEYPDLKIIGNLRPENQDDILKRFKLDSDFTYQMLADVQPEVKLGQYKGFTLEVVKKQPDFSVINKRLRQYQINKSTLVPIENRPVQMGDVVIVDAEAFDLETNSEITELRQEDWDYDLDGDTSFPEIAQALLGAQVGDMVEARIEPSERFALPNPVRFVITIKDIKQRELPPLDDEFARAISSKETMAELRQYLEEVAIAEAQEETEANVLEVLFDQILAQTEIELPESIVDDAVERIVNSRLQELGDRIDPQALRAVLEDQATREQIIAVTKPKAIATEKIKLILAEIAKLEKISVPSDLIEQQYQLFVQANGKKPKNPQEVKNAISIELLQQKVVQFLKENSTIVLVDATGEVPPTESNPNPDSNTTNESSTATDPEPEAIS